MNITLYPLGLYNSGFCHPFTIDLDNIDQDDYHKAINHGLFNAEYHKGDGNVLSSRCIVCDHIVIGSVLKDCPECQSEAIEIKVTDEEWIVCDYEGVPPAYVGDYDLSTDFFAYSQYLETTHLDREAIDAGLSAGFDLLSIEEVYYGKYDSDINFAEQWADDTDSYNAELTWPHDCIDWDQAARNLMQEFTSHKHHYFSLR
ncbi:MAG: antirestriction protein ArdA [Methylococcales bacterium]|jgi:antirestriction protein